jgi:DNA repair exonuclease SbcCD ATPase subunit
MNDSQIKNMQNQFKKYSAQLQILKTIMNDCSKMTLQSKIERRIDKLTHDLKGLNKAIQRPSGGSTIIKTKKKECPACGYDEDHCNGHRIV